VLVTQEEQRPHFVVSGSQSSGEIITPECDRQRTKPWIFIEGSREVWRHMENNSRLAPLLLASSFLWSSASSCERDGRDWG
jgi:hypothetical protein